MADCKLTKKELSELHIKSIGVYLRQIPELSNNAYNNLNHIEKPEKVKADKIEDIYRLVVDITLQFKRLDNMIKGL